MTKRDEKLKYENMEECQQLLLQSFRIATTCQKEELYEASCETGK
jgi:hypothetical protein